MSNRRTTVVILVVLAALLSGLLITAIAIALSGGGHGWNSALISASAVITAPAGVLCWFVRSSQTGHRLTVTLIVVNVAIVFVFVIQTMAEGAEHVIRVWRALPGYAVAWMILWLVWQIVPVAGLVSRRRRAG